MKAIFVGLLFVGFNLQIVFAQNVGIGTNAPTQLLEVFNGTTTGTYTTTGWVHSSDLRLKTNIQGISNAMTVVNQLIGVWYEWKNNPEAGRRAGFIA